MNSRLIASRVISLILKDGQSLTTALDKELQKIASSKDRSFIQALSYGVTRQYYRLDYILNLLLHKPLIDIELRSLALIGLYQLIYMRVKPHAAVSETVSAVRKKPRAKSLLNAVLRNFIRRQEVLEEKADSNMSAAVSHPDWLIKQIQHNWPQQVAKILEENNKQAPMVLRVNIDRCSRDDYLDQLLIINMSACISPYCHSAIILEHPVAVDLLPGFKEGLVSVQDTAPQFAAELLDVKPGHRVLDVCAAPGGKTAHILEIQPKLSCLLALDIDEARLISVHETLQRLHLSAELAVGDATKTDDWWDGKPFHRILLDSPCSALGVIRRHPDIKLLRRDMDIKQLLRLQREILHAVWKLLAPDGVLLYATCSILKQENTDQIKAFLTKHSDAVEVPLDVNWGIDQEYGKQILPGEAGMDGFYYAKIKKK